MGGEGNTPTDRDKPLAHGQHAERRAGDDWDPVIVCCLLLICCSAAQQAEQLDALTDTIVYFKKCDYEKAKAAANQILADHNHFRSIPETLHRFGIH